MNSTVETYLPCFSGFYGSIWESDHTEEQQIEWINKLREEFGAPPIEWDDAKFDTETRESDVSRYIARCVEYDLRELGMVESIEFQSVRSSREYNFTNDSADICVAFTRENRQAIYAYLEEHEEAFATFVKDRYTSRSGFMSHYPKDSTEYLREGDCRPLEHMHKAGSILEFILANDAESDDREWGYFENYEDDIDILNYAELTDRDSWLRENSPERLKWLANYENPLQLALAV